MTSKTLRDIGETAFLRRLHRRMATRTTAPRWQVGVGDDAAVFSHQSQVVVSTDMVVEDVDFRRRWATWRDVGIKAAAINLSDMAAMGAQPKGLTAALAASGNELASDMLQLLLACHATGDSCGAPLIGGDLSETTGPVVLSVTALGVADGPLLLRHQGQVGDVIALTGTVGAARAGLALLERPELKKAVGAKAAASLMARQLRPTAQVAAGRALAQIKKVRSAADVSDGLHKDVAHVLGLGMGARICTDALPIARGVEAVAIAAGANAVDWALLGGEDFELVLAVDPRHLRRAVSACQRLGVALTAVGEVTARPGVTYVGHAAPTWRHGQGFAHFAAR